MQNSVEPSLLTYTKYVRTLQTACLDQEALAVGLAVLLLVAEHKKHGAGVSGRLRSSPPSFQRVHETLNIGGGNAATKKHPLRDDYAGLEDWEDCNITALCRVLLKSAGITRKRPA